MRIILSVGSALKYAHSRNMVHRDVKPANVMITSEGHVILTDFGIAKIISATKLTASGAMVGTPAYMSPEQGRGEPGDERSDIYSLGVMLYQLVVGRLPYDAETPVALVLKHINDPLPLPTALRPDLSRGYRTRHCQGAGEEARRSLSERGRHDRRLEGGGRHDF